MLLEKFSISVLPLTFTNLEDSVSWPPYRLLHRRGCSQKTITSEGYQKSIIIARERYMDVKKEAEIVTYLLCFQYSQVIQHIITVQTSSLQLR